jgi:hypothetical protein
MRLMMMTMVQNDHIPDDQQMMTKWKEAVY